MLQSICAEAAAPGQWGCAMSSAAIDVIEANYRAFADGDVARITALLAQVDWEEAAGMPYGGRYHGAQAVFENVLGPIGQDVQDFTARPDELLPIGGDRVLALGRYRGTGARGALDVPFAHLWTVTDGKITRFVQYADTALFRQATGR